MSCSWSFVDQSSFTIVLPICAFLTTLFLMQSVLPEWKYERPHYEHMICGWHWTRRKQCFPLHVTLLAMKKDTSVVCDEIALESRNDCHNFWRIWFIVSSFIFFASMYVFINCHLVYDRVGIIDEPITQSTECIYIRIDVLEHLNVVLQDCEVEIGVESSSKPHMLTVVWVMSIYGIKLGGRSGMSSTVPIRWKSWPCYVTVGWNVDCPGTWSCHLAITDIIASILLCLLISCLSCSGIKDVPFKRSFSNKRGCLNGENVIFPKLQHS